MNIKQTKIYEALKKFRVGGYDRMTINPKQADTLLIALNMLPWEVSESVEKTLHNSTVRTGKTTGPSLDDLSKIEDLLLIDITACCTAINREATSTAIHNYKAFISTLHLREQCAG